ncbi:MAG: GspH/FimT family pseudopilin [SAR324 cluster bacterium]|nr:GspH/FimT family pseudopilin [SAR324 cluster bacterium]
MRTSPTPTSRRGGFTFIEVMVVIVILAVVMGLSLPAFFSVLESGRDREINRLSSVLHLLRSEAILGRKQYRLQIDLEAGAYWAEARDDRGRFHPILEPASLRRHILPEFLQLQDIAVYGTTAGRITRQVVPITIDSSGFIDPFLLHFKEGQDEWTFRLTGFTGRVDLIEGYTDDLRP